MEVCELLEVDRDSLFALLSQSVVQEIAQALSVPPEQIEPAPGLTYSRPMNNWRGKTGTVKMEIVEFRAPECYEVRILSVDGTTTITYLLEEAEGDFDKDAAEHVAPIPVTRVTYREEYEGSSRSLNLNRKIMQPFFKRGAKRRIVRRLHEMERYVKSFPRAEENIEDHVKEVS